MSQKRGNCLTLLLIVFIAVVLNCDLIPVETPGKIFEDDYKNYWPSLSPDGKYLLFCSDKDDVDDQDDEYDIWCLELETDELTQFTVNQPEEYYSEDMYPCWSADSQWVYFLRGYADQHGFEKQLCRVPITGGEDNIEVLEYDIYLVDSDSTGQRLATYWWNNGNYCLAVYDITSDELTPIPGTEGISCGAIKFSPDDSAVWASLRDENRIKIYPLNGEEPVVFNYEWTQEPKRISFSPAGDEVLIEFNNQLVRCPIEGGAGEDITPEDIIVIYDGAWMSDGYIYYIKQESYYTSAIWRFKP